MFRSHVVGAHSAHTGAGSGRDPLGYSLTGESVGPGETLQPSLSLSCCSQLLSGLDAKASATAGT